MIKELKKIITITILLIILINLLILQKSEARNIDVAISAPTALLIESGTGQIIYEKNSNKKIYPASITKLMTAIIAVEQCNLEDIAIVSYNSIFKVPSGYVKADLQEDEELSIKDLLNLMLIPSANDAANVLAEHISGSIESFATMMNTKAIELGCENTNFVNPSGIHNKNHYSTAYDLYLIGKYAMQKEEIKEILTKESYTLSRTNKNENTTRRYNTSNYMIDKNEKKYFYEYVIGGKTGYTGEAGDCVIEFAKKDDIELVAVIIGEKYDKNNRIKFIECKKLFEEIFNNYEKINLAQKDEEYKIIDIKQKKIKLVFEDSLDVVVKKGYSDEIKKVEEVNMENVHQLKKGENAGQVIYNINEEEYKVNIKIENTNEKGSKIFRIIILIFNIYLIINIKQTMKKKNKR